MEKLCFRRPQGPGCEMLLHGAPGTCRPSTGCRAALPRWFTVAGSRERRPWARHRCGLGKGKPPPLVHKRWCWAWLPKVSRNRELAGAAEGLSDALVPGGRASVPGEV